MTQNSRQPSTTTSFKLGLKSIIEIEKKINLTHIQKKTSLHTLSTQATEAMSAFSGEPAAKRLKVSALKKGEILSATVYYHVDNVGTTLKVHDLGPGHGANSSNSLNYGASVAEREAYTASQFEKVIKCSRTEIIKKLQGAGDSVFTVGFKKKNGDKRELRGYRIPGIPDTCFGRSEVYDLDVDKYAYNVKNDEGQIVHRKGETFAPDITETQKRKHQKRECDHRTVYELILKNVKYVLK